MAHGLTSHYRSIVPYSDEWYDIREALRSLMAKHFLKLGDRTHRDYADHFLAAYETMRGCFWQGKSGTGYTVDASLQELSIALSQLSRAYNNLPTEIQYNLSFTAWDIDEERIKNFQKSQLNRGFYFKSEEPAQDTNELLKMLRELVLKSDQVLATFALERARLPAGIPTSNRPIAAWCVVEAAATIARLKKEISVPKKIDASNPSGPFFRFLSDLFEIFNIITSVPGAFNGWRKHMDGKIKDSDLLPID